MKCGDRGFVTVDGRPCGQTIGARAKACLWHIRTAEERRALALQGGIASRLRTVAVLPPSTPLPVLDSPEGVRAELAGTIQDASRLDHRIAAVVISGLSEAIRLGELQVAAQIGALERRLRLRGA